MKRRKANRFGHILGRNSILKHVFEEKMEVTGRRGVIHKRLLSDL